MRPIKKAPGTKLTSYTASVTLADGAVAEGDEIPYSKATVTPVSYADLTLEKYCKAVSIEAVNQYGAVVAVEKTDNAFLKELQSKVMTKFYDFVKTGTLINFLEQFPKFMQQMRGKNPTEILNGLISSGKVSQQQLDTVQRQARQMSGMFEQFRGMFCK